MSGILDGVRIVSFTAGVAGPTAARLLAQCGAEVIKLESRHGGLDGFRLFAPSGDINAAPRFIEANLNVLSAQLDLKHPTGKRLALELIARSDVVLDNFRADVLPRLGLGPAELRAVREDLIILKMPGLGSSGPKHWYGTWGSSLQAYSGMTYLWNHPGQERPVGYQGVFPDYVAGAFTPTVVVAALLHRARTGRGVYLDLAQAEALAYTLGVGFLDAAINHREPPVLGNDWPDAAPHNVYPCQGDDRWCAIAVQTDAQWRALCGAMEQSDLANDPRFATHAQRRAHLVELDQVLSVWTSQREAHAVMRALQAVGVPCGVVPSGEELFHDPQLNARGLVSSVEHPALGTLPVADIPVHLSENGLVPPRNTATLGEHNAYVVCELLGYSPEQLAAWQAEGAVE